MISWFISTQWEWAVAEPHTHQWVQIYVTALPLHPQKYL